MKSIMIKAMSSLNPAGSPSQGIKRCSFVKVASMSDTVLFAVGAMMHKFKQYSLELLLLERAISVHKKELRLCIWSTFL